MEHQGTIEVGYMLIVGSFFINPLNSLIYIFGPISQLVTQHDSKAQVARGLGFKPLCLHLFPVCIVFLPFACFRSMYGYLHLHVQMGLYMREGIK